MRILFFSNYFPPYARGGYEQWCAEVAVEMRRRGHEVHVITGQERAGSAPCYEDVPVHRILSLEAREGTWETAWRFFLTRKKQEQRSHAQVKQLIDETKPDAALIWGMWNVPRSIPALVEQSLAGRVAYYFCDYWPTLPSAYEQYWRTPSGRSVTKAVKQVLGQLALRQLRRESRPALRLENCFFVSRAVCQSFLQSGVTMGRTAVIHGGTQVEQFETATTGRVPRTPGSPLRLLYCGRLHPDKGVHTAIAAIGKLQRGAVRLTICGDDRSPYGEHLHLLAQKEGVSEYTFFRGSVPRSQIPEVMAQHDVLLFPSVWEEPFARTLMEGMAAGLTVVGTTTGGSGEILVENETGLTFPAEDAKALADQIDKLLSDPCLCHRLGAAGHRFVSENLRFEHMVDALESQLEALAGCGGN
ncbi:MAG: glycosyltransferase family 4 protein [Chloroflexi bacterium]|nr:glycosyltransferase family 4 protein [Chloroflexota bacterium]